MINEITHMVLFLRTSARTTEYNSEEDVWLLSISSNGESWLQALVHPYDWHVRLVFKWYMCLFTFYSPSIRVGRAPQAIRPWRLLSYRPGHSEERFWYKYDIDSKLCKRNSGRSVDGVRFGFQHIRIRYGRCMAVFTARGSYASAVLGVVILSVCPSVTRVLCDKAKQPLRTFWYRTKEQSL